MLGAHAGEGPLVDQRLATVGVTAELELLAGHLGEAPLVGADNVLATGELELGAAEGLDNVRAGGDLAAGQGVGRRYQPDAGPPW